MVPSYTAAVVPFCSAIDSGLFLKDGCKGADRILCGTTVDVEDPLDLLEERQTSNLWGRVFEKPLSAGAYWKIVDKRMG